MSRKKADEISYQEALFMSRPVLFTEYRVDRNTLPEGMFLYELRHADQNWNRPCQLQRNILVNFYGTVITSDAIQLPPGGSIEFQRKDFRISRDKESTLSDFMERNPPVGENVIHLFNRRQEGLDDPYFYSQSEEQDKASGCIGHLRGDFGSGSEFHTTWWPHQNDALNTSDFKQDIDRVVNWLREGFAPLKDLKTMENYCRWSRSEIPSSTLPAYGYCISTNQYEYLLRCSPLKGDYNFYLYCYDRAALDQHRQMQQAVDGKEVLPILPQKPQKKKGRDPHER